MGDSLKWNLLYITVPVGAFSSTTVERFFCPEEGSGLNGCSQSGFDCVVSLQAIHCGFPRDLMHSYCILVV